MTLCRLIFPEEVQPCRWLGSLHASVTPRAMLAGDSSPGRTKKTTTIATWNVRTMYEAGKAAQVSAEMRRYNIALLGLSETRWLQAGQKRLASGELLLYSGHEEVNATHTEGIAIML